MGRVKRARECDATSAESPDMREGNSSVFRGRIPEISLRTQAGRNESDGLFHYSVMDSLTHIRRQIEIRHACTAHYLQSVAVREMAQDEVLWEGSVEVFQVDHAQADRCYAWVTTGRRGEIAIITLLGIPPVSSPQAAVRSVLAGVRAMERNDARSADEAMDDGLAPLFVPRSQA